MNTANKITLVRVVLIPVYIFLFLINTQQSLVWAGIIFIGAALTDTLDGYIARKKEMVTDFGKFVDPLADKLLVLSALICFSSTGRIWSVFAIILLSREMIITSLRALAAGSNRVLAADKWGKLKTVFQMNALIFMHFEFLSPILVILSNILFYIAVILTIISGCNYLYKNKDLILATK